MIDDEIKKLQNNKAKKVGFTLPTCIYEAFKERCEKLDVRQSQVITLMIELFLERTDAQ